MRSPPSPISAPASVRPPTHCRWACEPSVLYREVGHAQGEAYAQATLGYAHRQLGQYDQAILCFEQGLAINRVLGARYWEAHTLDQIGDLYRLKGERDRAATAWGEAATIFEHLRHPEATAVRAKLSEAS
jgi:tetratricopeptide (TPR) repeat protein